MSDTIKKILTMTWAEAKAAVICEREPSYWIAKTLINGYHGLDGTDSDLRTEILEFCDEDETKVDAFLKRATLAPEDLSKCKAWLLGAK